MSSGSGSGDVICRSPVDDDRVRKHFGNTISSDFFDLVCGEFLGGGVGRAVYGCMINPDVVLKIETPGCSFQNVAEWQVWEEVQFDDRLRPWFAPCLTISPCGIILVMERTYPPKVSFRWPERMPSFITDLKTSNFGMFEDRLVCHDYGLHKMISSGTSLRERKVEWRAD